MREGLCGGLGCGREEEPKNEHFRSYISRIWGDKPLDGSAQNFTLGDIQDVITDANFGIDRLRGFNVARGQILGFSIAFAVVLPYTVTILSHYRASV